MQINNINSKQIVSICILVISLVILAGLGFLGLKIFQAKNYQPQENVSANKIQEPALFDKIGNTQTPAEIIKGSQTFGTTNPFAPK